MSEGRDEARGRAVHGDDDAPRAVASPVSTVEDQRAGRDGPPSLALTPDEAIVAYDDEERPARRLTGPVERLVAVVAFAVALLVLWQVFRPLSQGSQFYLIIFLAGVLPLVFLSYRSGLPLPARLRRPRRDDRDLPTPLDWVLAAVALVVCLYPVLPFGIGEAGGGYNAFLDRQVY